MWKILKFIAHVIYIEIQHGLGMTDKEYMNTTVRKELVLDDTY